MTVIFVFNVNIPSTLRPPGLLPPDPGSPIPVPKTGDPVNLAACRLLKGTVHSSINFKKICEIWKLYSLYFFPF